MYQNKKNFREGFIMTKTFILEDLDCAHCAGVIEEKIQKLDEVKSAQVNFMSRRLVIDAEESAFDKIVKDAKKIIKKVEPDVEMVAAKL